MSTSALLPMLFAAAVGAPPAAVGARAATGLLSARPSTAPSTAPSTSSGQAFLIVPAGAAARDAARDVVLRAAVASVSAVVDEAAGAALLADARDAGLACEPEDDACWLRVAELGGARGVVFIVGDVVTVTSDDGTHAASVMGPGDASLVAATRRAFGVAGELRVAVTTPQAAVSVDGAPVAVQRGVAVASVPPGEHVIVVGAPGFAAARTALRVARGAVVVVPVALTASAAPSSSSVAWGAALRWSGAGVLTAAAVGAGTLVAVGQVPYLACYEARSPLGCAKDGAIRTAADDTAVAALVTAVAGAVVGGGALAAGLIVE
ncbi:MAG: hypothetical protein FJ137_03720 [Deltaproteobacteria bacterium]|nr:hypothetical protein [Deltaproteobacteria bacterium]